MLWVNVVIYFAAWALAATREFHFNASLVLANPDGEHDRPMIGINGQWPNPVIRVKKNDRVIVHMTNGMDDRNVLLHFHGLFMRNSASMDGPEQVNQCPIPPGHTFTYDFVVEQSGLYWYHSHLGSQYSDGLRGIFLVEEEEQDEYPFEFNKRAVLSVGDHYHKESKDLMKDFKSRYNPTGAEPVPQSALFNESHEGVWRVEPDTLYFLQIVNMGMFASQYVYIEGHQLTVVEIDGVYVDPVTVDLLYISVAQRYGVLVQTKRKPEAGSFRFVNVLDQVMFDYLPDGLRVISTNYMDYTDDAEHPAPLPASPKHFDALIETLSPADDFKLVPVELSPLLEPDYLLVLNFTMDNLGDGVNYAFFNNVTYTPPKVPTLYTVMSSGNMADNAAIYGSNTNTFVLQADEVVEIVLNNMDPGLHPFHLHGHNFQVVARSEGTDDDDNPQIYDPLQAPKFPEYPMVRDTVMVNANGYVVLRFKASNPGVWFFHCHVDWHLEQGLAITFVESPKSLQDIQLHPSHMSACDKLSIPMRGNAAGRFGESESAWLDLTGENVQPEPLPLGFTARGYVALLACTLAAVYGVVSIYQYGMEDLSQDNAEHVIANLYKLLGENGGELLVH